VITSRKAGFWERFAASTVRGIVGALVTLALLHGCPAYKRRMCETYCGGGR
jgi:hypothetical protein